MKKFLTEDLFITPVKHPFTKLSDKRKYKVNAIVECSCGTTSYVLDVPLNWNNNSICPKCKKPIGIQGFAYPIPLLFGASNDNWRFSKIGVESLIKEYNDSVNL